MLVRLRRTFIWQGNRYRKLPDGAEIPDDAAPELPTDALIWEDGEWMPVVEEDENGKPILDEKGQKVRRELDLPPPKVSKRPVNRAAQAKSGPMKDPGRPDSQPQGLTTANKTTVEVKKT